MLALYVVELTDVTAIIGEWQVDHLSYLSGTCIQLKQ